MKTICEKMETLFDAQSFIRCPELQAMIDDTLARCGDNRVELSDEDVASLNAAGPGYMSQQSEQEN